MPAAGSGPRRDSRTLTPDPSRLVPAVLDGQTHAATVVELSPWVEYEFRVVASNKIGGGEPSLPSEKVRTEEAG